MIGAGNSSTLQYATGRRRSWKNRPYDIAPDGRFLIIRSGQVEAGVGTATNMIVVQNWLEELSGWCR
jgi:hypothetical protein